MFKNFKQGHTKGFTLIELIVVIAILAVLVTIVIVAINPAEQLARSRDSKRVADLDGLRSAWNLYLAQATSVNLSGDSTDDSSCKSGTGKATLFFNTNTTMSSSTSSGFWQASSNNGQSICSSSGCATSTSWAPALLGQTPGGSPIANLPLDPTGLGSGTSFWYAYACDDSDKTYEFDAILESTYYKTTLNLMGTDGGNSSTLYEIGSKLTII